MTALLTGICLAGLLVAMFPANIKAAREQVMLDGKPANRAGDAGRQARHPLWFRSMVQVVFVATLLWATLS